MGARREIPNEFDGVEVHMDPERRLDSLVPSIEISVPFGMRRSQGEVTATLADGRAELRCRKRLPAGNVTRHACNGCVGVASTLRRANYPTLPPLRPRDSQ